MAGASSGPHRYHYYLCINHKAASALCAIATRHRKERLEAAVLEYLGQYDDPTKVEELLQVQDTLADQRQEQEFNQVTARLKALETAFLADLDRVDRGVMTEPEYLKRQEVRRSEQAALEPRKVELEKALQGQRDRDSQIVTVPVKVRSFLEDFQDMEVPRAKAILQTILKTARVWKDGCIELEFR